MNPNQKQEPQGPQQPNPYADISNIYPDVSGPPPPPPSAAVPGKPQIVPKAETPPNPNSTQNSLQISEVRDGIAIMNDGSFRAVVMCKAINFDLMSGEEREAVEFSYQGFLNSLHFPIQIFVRSQKVDLGPYLQKLGKIRSQQGNMLLAMLMEDYVGFLAEVAQQTNIMDKKFYVVISYPDPDENIRSAVKQSKGFFSGLTELFRGAAPPHVVIDEAALENAKTELRNRVQAVMQGLQDCGVQSLPLDTQELIALYYDAYNPDTASRQQLKSFDDLAAPVITKGSGNAPQPNLESGAA